jgi:hypothetical protein
MRLVSLRSVKLPSSGNGPQAEGVQASGPDHFGAADPYAESRCRPNVPDACNEIPYRTIG